MKKVLLTAIALLGLSGMTYAGNGTLANPFSVDEVLAKGDAANEPGVYVEGIIVGFINGMSYTDAVFGLPTADQNQTNIILAGSSGENDIKYCLPVQLPAGDVRTNLNLWKNPDVLYHKVILGGDIIKYFGQIGIKNTTSYEWVGEAPELGTGGNGGGNGGGSSQGGYLTNGMDDFTIDYVNLPEELSYVWSWDATYGAKASAFYNSTNYASEAILISPEITLPADAQAASFSQALNYLSGNNRADYVNVVVREGSNGTWNTVEVSEWPAGNSWGFSDNCQINLSAYSGKTIQIGFRYTSTASCAPTWEVKNLVIGGSYVAPEQPEQPEGDGVTFYFDDPTAYGFTPAESETEISLAGKTIEKDGVKITFAQQDDASTDIRLFKSSAGTWSFRFYNKTSFTVTAPDGNHLTGVVFAGSNLDKNWSYSSGTFTKDTWTPTTETNAVTVSKVASGDNPAIDSITVYYSDGEFNPDEPDTPVTPPADNLENVTYNFGDPTAYGFNPGADETEISIAGETFTEGKVSLSFAQQDDASTNIRLFKSSAGRWSFRFYNKTSFTVSVPEGYNLAKIEFAGNNLGVDWSYSNGSLSGTTWTPSGDVSSVTIGKTANGNNPVIDTMTVYYTAAAGVEDILAADDSQAVYFNLQGQKVNNPERGIFIKVVNGKAVKVVK